jgi:hypothetical protein
MPRKPQAAAEAEATARAINAESWGDGRYGEAAMAAVPLFLGLVR